MHFRIADDGESATAFVFFIIEIAFDNNGIAFGRVLFGILARFCKFEGKPLRTTGESVGNDATVKTPFQFFVVIARKDALHLDMLSEILAWVHDHLVNLPIDHGPAHAGNVNVVFFITIRLLCKQGCKGKQNGKNYFEQLKHLCLESG